MGGMNFGPKILADGLSETAGYKAGLALSIEELCDHLSGTEYPDIIIASEKNGTRIRSDEYEELFYRLLYRIGYLKDEYFGWTHDSVRIFHKYRKNGKLDSFEGVSKIFSEHMRKNLENSTSKQKKPIDATKILFECKKNSG